MRPLQQMQAPSVPSGWQRGAVASALLPPRGPPVQVRKAWGQSVPEGITMAGEFEFNMELADKDSLGEMLTWHMLSAGIAPQLLDQRFLKFTSKRGQVASTSKDEVARLLENPANYPVKVKYDPPRVFRGMTPDSVTTYEAQRIWLRFVKDAVAALNADMSNVRHKHQKRTFERYLLYLEDHYYQNEDRLDDVTPLPEYLKQYPFMAFTFSLTDKTGPNLARVLRGEVDILEYLFGS